MSHRQTCSVGEATRAGCIPRALRLQGCLLTAALFLIILFSSDSKYVIMTLFKYVQMSREEFALVLLSKSLTKMLMSNFRTNTMQIPSGPWVWSFPGTEPPSLGEVAERHSFTFGLVNNLFWHLDLRNRSAHGAVPHGLCCLIC